jgi:gas vesicle protein
MNENPYLNEESRSGASGMSGFMLGAIVGSGVALLFAPAAGTDTRRKLGETAKRLGSAARDKVQEVGSAARDKVQEVGSAARDKMQEVGSAARDKVQEGTDKLHDRFGSGSEAGRREPVPSTGSSTNPGQTGRTGTTPGRTNP